MQIAVLGPLEVIADGVAVAVPGARLRALLTRLAVDAPRVVPTGELVAAIWTDDPPADAANALQSLVSRLRRTLGGPQTVLAELAGYRLPVAAEAVDLHRFEALAERVRGQLRDGDPSAAAETSRTALELWRSEPLSDAGDAAYATPIVTACQSRRLELIEIRNDRLLDLGRGPELIAELTQLVDEHPLHEQFVVQLLRALAAAGRTNEALAAYERCRSYLADELGGDPGATLQDVHLALLRGELPAVGQAQASSAPAVQTNLGQSLTSFVGRESELARIAAALATSRLTTVVGPGGAGKTRIATEAAKNWLDASGKPAWMVELAPVGTAANITGAILSALGLRDTRVLDRNDRTPSPDETERLVNHLRQQPCLLVLDNCEHLVDGAAKVADDLLARVPALRILATSREPLAITGEVLCPLPPLHLPPADCPLERAQDYAAVRLWLDRATALDAGFVLDADTLGPVLEIVRRLDGLPLAIELAAARLRALPVADIARLLSDRFRLLTGGSRTSMPRHRTLRAVVEWSWDLLTESERLLAMRLAIFPAGAGIDTATAICADDRLAAGTVEELLITLTDKSLLQRSSASPVRFRMLETIREYGIERLSEADQLDAARERHADYFLELVQDLEPALRDRRQLAAREQLDLERDNIFAAIQYLLDNDRAHDGLLMTLALLWYFQVQDHEGELSYWLEQAILALDGADDPLLVYARAAAAVAAVTMESENAWDTLKETLGPMLPDLERAPQAPFASLNALRMLLPLYLNFGSSDAFAADSSSPVSGAPRLPMAYVERIVAEAEQQTDPWTRGMAFLSASGVSENRGDLEAVDRYSTRAYQEFERCGDRWGLSSTLNFRAQVNSLRGDNAAAMGLLKESLELSPLMGAEDDALIIHLRLAALAMRSGDLPAARQYLQALRNLDHRGRLDRERQLFADAAETELRWLEGDYDGALELAASVRGQVSQDEPPHRFSGHRLAISTAATASVEAAAAARAGTDSVEGRRHLVRGLADLRAGYRATVLTEDIPLVSEFTTAHADLAAVSGEVEKAAFLLGVGAGLLGVDNPADGHRNRVKTRIAERLGPAEADKLYQAGKDISRAEGIAAVNPEQLITELGLGDQLPD